MTQNIYDNPEFFQNYSRLSRSVDGLDGANEWPRLRAMLPDMTGLRVVDLGCGFGWFARWARTRGASSVQALDVSEQMLARARTTTDDPAITYTRVDLERLDLPAASVDFAYSSLVLHYIEDLAGLMAAVARLLVPGGGFVFSVEHPIMTAPSRQGWAIDGEGRKTWPLDGYLLEGTRTTNWLTKGVVKRHRTVARYLTLLIGAGFNLTEIEEWGPSDDQIAATPALADERHRPFFLLVAARRSG